MGEVYVYDKWAEDFSTTGLCGALTPFSCRHEEIAGGMSAVTLEHPFDDLGRWKHIQRGNVLKCLCRVRTTPEILNGQVSKVGNVHRAGRSFIALQDKLDARRVAVHGVPHAKALGNVLSAGERLQNAEAVPGSRLIVLQKSICHRVGHMDSAIDWPGVVVRHFQQRVGNPLRFHRQRAVGKGCVVRAEVADHVLLNPSRSCFRQPCIPHNLPQRRFVVRPLCQMIPAKAASTAAMGRSASSAHESPLPRMREGGMIGAVPLEVPFAALRHVAEENDL